MFKSEIIKRIVTNENAVKLINPTLNPKLELDDVLLGGKWIIKGEEITEQGHIFSYNYVDSTTTGSKVFICIEALPYKYKYPMIDVLLYIHIYVHKNIMNLTSKVTGKPSTPSSDEMYKLGFIGNRCDQLTQVIGSILNGASNMGGIKEITPHERGHITLSIPNNEFYGKCMIFDTKISNVEYIGCENN